MTILTPAAIAALPFTVDLPAGFRVTSSRSSAEFQIYAIRKGEEPFVMVEVGPSTMYPIYSGEEVTAGGRTSMVTTEMGRRRAVEHLFQRATAPREVHVWVSSVSPADQAAAEQIAQSVDVR